MWIDRATISSFPCFSRYLYLYFPQLHPCEKTQPVGKKKYSLDGKEHFTYVTLFHFFFFRGKISAKFLSLSLSFLSLDYYYYHSYKMKEYVNIYMNSFDFVRFCQIRMFLWVATKLYHRYDPFIRVATLRKMTESIHFSFNFVSSIELERAQLLDNWNSHYLLIYSLFLVVCWQMATYNWHKVKQPVYKVQKYRESTWSSHRKLHYISWNGKEAETAQAWPSYCLCIYCVP